ncbi:MFS transporter [Streptoalloteichus hindustanus]|uniref:hypothetical protein n=1 Tax=Streptoalloteichus hindustanus TaxID=2017 RepID=UPI001F246788|nr:hypothetical protein [Streptoalloteichus hindustanus]
MGLRFVTALAVVSGVGLLVSVPELPGSGSAGIRQRLGAVRIRRAPSAMLVTMLWVLGTFVVYTYLGTLLDSVTHATSAAEPWLLLAFGVGSFAGVLLGGRLSDRVNPTAGLAGSLALLTVVLAVLGLALRSVPGAAVGLAFWGLVHWASFPLIQHRLLGIGGSHGDVLLALNNSAVYLGQTLAAALGGVFASAGLLTALPVSGAGFELLALLALALSTRAHRSTAREAHASETPVVAPASASGNA